MKYDINEILTKVNNTKVKNSSKGKAPCLVDIWLLLVLLEELELAKTVSIVVDLTGAQKVS